MVVTESQTNNSIYNTSNFTKTSIKSHKLLKQFSVTILILVNQFSFI